VISELEAGTYVLERCAVGDVVEASIADAVGHVLAAPVVAAEDVPPFANSAVDGYAVKAADVAATPTRLRVVAEVAAGWSTEREVGAGEAMIDLGIIQLYRFLGKLDDLPRGVLVNDIPDLVSP